MEKVIYIVSLVSTIIFILLLPIRKEKSNILLRTTITILLLFSLAIITSIILYIVGIEASLSNYSVLNLIIILFCIIKILKNKEIQKYEFKISDIVFIILTVLVLVAFAIFNYGIPMVIKYKTTDASSHFSAAMNFMKENALLLESNSTVSNYFGFSSLMIGAYVNEGIFFSIFEGILDDINFYKLYIVFDLIMLLISATVMYEAILQIGKKRKTSIIAIIVSLIYLVGYPLNTVIMGTAYLTLNLSFMTAIILIFGIKEKIPSKYFKVILFLFNIGIMHTYTMLGIIAILAEIIYLAINEKRKCITTIFISILLPILTGIIYIVFENQGIQAVINLEGPIFRNYYSNFILYLPIVIYVLYVDVKNKNNKIENHMLIAAIICIIIAFILKVKQQLSSYYYFKFYYILWIIIMFELAKGINSLIEKHFKIGIIYCIVTITALIISFPMIDYTYDKEEIMQDISKENFFCFADIFRMNFNIIINGKNILNNEEIKIIEQAKAIPKDEMEIIRWYRANCLDLCITKLRGI